jgi:NhaP-type Na+/H+ or K+/H+ antiporter
VGPVKADFLTKFCMLFDALSSVVFEDMPVVFNPMKIIQGTCLGPILLKKCFLERYLIGPVTFLLLFLTVGNYLSSQGNNTERI